MLQAKRVSGYILDISGTFIYNTETEILVRLEIAISFNWLKHPGYKRVLIKRYPITGSIDIFEITDTLVKRN